MGHLTLLGPQRKAPCVAQVIAELNNPGRVAVVTAGWEERESELDEMRAHLGENFEAVGLGLSSRAQQLFDDDPELREALVQHAEQRLRLRELYQLRLEHAADAVYALLADADEERAELSRHEADDALRVVTALDTRHLERLAELQTLFEERWSPDKRPAFADARAEVAERLEPCTVLAIAGGHVGVLLDRLQLFGIRQLIGKRDVVAWSAGAMACTEKILLFHDSPPQGRGHAEMHAHGLALAPGLVALPHAATRLLLDNQQRVSVLAKRCAPALCVCLDQGSRADWDGSSWTIAPNTRWMNVDGTLSERRQKAGAI